MHLNNSALKIDTRREGVDVRVVCEMPGLQTNPFVGFAEWTAIAGITNILRSAAGPDWCPAEITYVPMIDGHVTELHFGVKSGGRAGACALPGGSPGGGRATSRTCRSKSPALIAGDSCLNAE